MVKTQLHLVNTIYFQPIELHITIRMPWFVVYTRSRSEKLAANGLSQRGVEVYCPTRKVKRKWSDRIKIIEEPLFKSYCFVNLDENKRHTVYGVPGVVGYVLWLKKPAIVRQKEIDLIKNMLNDFDPDSLTITDLKPADRLKITSGAFMDHKGEVVANRGKVVVVHIESLQISISVNISKNKIEKIPSSDPSL